MPDGDKGALYNFISVFRHRMELSAIQIADHLRQLIKTFIILNNYSFPESSLNGN